MTKTLLRTDRNGTKYYHCIDACFKCNGTGYISYYDWYQGGICFDCGGSGKVAWNEKEYTPEYEAKLLARRQARYEKKLAEAKAQAAEKNQEFFKNNGFNSEGKTFFILGNTYDIKEDLKAQGAKWDAFMGHWRMAFTPEGLNSVEVSVDDLYYTDEAGQYFWNNWKNDETIVTTITNAENALKKAESISEYVGEEGQRITLNLKYEFCTGYETDFGYTLIHMFKDENGNDLIWKTGNSIDAEYGSILKVTGTIKAHNEYKGKKQTILTRCKIN